PGSVSGPIQGGVSDRIRGIMGRNARCVNRRSKEAPARYQSATSAMVSSEARARRPLELAQLDPGQAGDRLLVQPHGGLEAVARGALQDPLAVVGAPAGRERLVS